jgi:hypothetical protein
MAAAIERHDQLLRSTVERHGGHVFSTGGDGFAVAFARAGDAIAAAVDAQLALIGETWPTGAPLQVRMGLHTGEVQERDGDYFGPAVNRAARLMSLAHGGQVIASAATADVVADTLPPEIKLVDLGEHLLRDLSRREHVFQVEAPGLGSDFSPLRSPDVLPGNLPVQPTSFVGRTDEIREVSEALERAHLVTQPPPVHTATPRRRRWATAWRRPAPPGGSCPPLPRRSPISHAAALAWRCAQPTWPEHGKPWVTPCTRRLVPRASPWADKTCSHSRSSTCRGRSLSRTAV